MLQRKESSEELSDFCQHINRHVLFLSFKLQTHLLPRLRARLRKLVLDAQKRLDQQSTRQQRDELLANPTTRALPNNHHAHRLAQNVTDALKRTNRLMLQEVERSSQTLQLMSKYISLH